MNPRWGFRRSRTLNRGSFRTAFRDDPEHHRSVMTLATRLCGKVFGFVKRNLSGAQRRKDVSSGQRVGERRQALSPPSAGETRSATSAPDFGNSSPIAANPETCRPLSKTTFGKFCEDGMLLRSSGKGTRQWTYVDCFTENCLSSFSRWSALHVSWDSRSTW